MSLLSSLSSRFSLGSLASLITAGISIGCPPVVVPTSQSQGFGYSRSYQSSSFAPSFAPSYDPCPASFPLEMSTGYLSQSSIQALAPLPYQQRLFLMQRYVAPSRALDIHSRFFSPASYGVGYGTSFVPRTTVNRAFPFTPGFNPGFAPVLGTGSGGVINNNVINVNTGRTGRGRTNAQQQRGGLLRGRLRF